MQKSSAANPYQLTRETILAPPMGLRQRLRFLGPGFILSASIVGSGELIATTRLGAEAGFVTFWVILVSCLVKVAVQLEFGKQAIYTGESTMEALNKLPGLRFGKANWTIWSWLFLMIFKLLQVGGIVGGTALVLNLAFPQISVAAWCYVTAVVVSLLIYQGNYRPIEKASVLMVAIFSLVTVISLGALQLTPLQISREELLSGLSFHLPAATVFVALGAFGITGVGGDEIMAYNYWLIEKGYAAYTGPREESIAWQQRAHGWIRVMYVDALLTMVIYTVVTIAFYLLGAAILHRQGLLPEGMELVKTLSRLYTQSLGNWAGAVFLLGAFVVLFSTLFAALASWTRLLSDAFGQIGWLDFKDVKQRSRAIAILAWCVPLIWATLFLLLKIPTLMVTIGGVATTVILLMIVYAALHFRYRRLPAALQPGAFYDAAFWVSVLAILLVALYGVFQLLERM
ncbi:Nramp family divalent metal transporter [candidate division KSB1 bacterium]|nr:Nramp family divalent metal transporter [candidate division KSB1 bacterium]